MSCSDIFIISTIVLLFLEKSEKSLVMDNQAYGGYPQAGVPYPQGVAPRLGSKINSSSSFDFVNSGFYLLLKSNIVNLLFIFLSMF